MPHRSCATDAPSCSGAKVRVAQLRTCAASGSQATARRTESVLTGSVLWFQYVRLWKRPVSRCAGCTSGAAACAWPGADSRTKPVYPHGSSSSAPAACRTRWNTSGSSLTQLGRAEERSMDSAALQGRRLCQAAITWGSSKQDGPHRHTHLAAAVPGTLPLAHTSHP